MNVRDLLGKALLDGGYGGLMNPYGDCGCVVGDLAPCQDDANPCPRCSGTGLAWRKDVGL